MPKRVLVIDLQEEEDADGKPVRDPRVFINPEIVDPAEDWSIYNEDCLSVPDQGASGDIAPACFNVSHTRTLVSGR